MDCIKHDAWETSEIVVLSVILYPISMQMNGQEKLDFM